MIKPKSTTPRMLYLVKRAEIDGYSRMVKALAKYELTPIQYTVLYFVDYDEGDLSSAQLSRRFFMTPQSMNELVAILEKKKLLKKTTDPAHKRILRIALTAKGKKTLDACNRDLDAVEEKMLQQLTSKEIETLRELLRKLIDTNREGEG
ncbi:DNA-binding transcriptional regulator, MarR family [Chryseolinea serpens]|uniref:DNA-binding transcriptional regulator, MarR family n=1 Tax=Chryseolinea serpens TaxID=947013 RepID=A0A1M5TCX4_9BACT|nr:MarR family winged helix-turn-helix transcriptional regulator [Chryseolinea serpens]SHH48480.1 DNA-binding transcriptional regulator, MarR family [Chryseolinea serpens]